MSEVFLSNKAELYGIVLSEFKKNGIQYRTETVNSGTQNRQTGIAWGQMGEKIDLQIMYYVYVNKENEMKARNIVKEIMRSHPA